MLRICSKRGRSYGPLSNSRGPSAARRLFVLALAILSGTIILLYGCTGYIMIEQTGAAGTGGGDDGAEPAAANPAGAFKFSAAEYPADWDADTAVLIVRRSGGAQGAVRVRFATADGSAAAAKDYTTRDGLLFWGDGDPSDREFSIALSGGMAGAGERSFAVTLSEPEGGAEIGDPSSAQVTIGATDVDPGAVYWARQDGGGANAAIAADVAADGDGTSTVAGDFSGDALRRRRGVRDAAHLRRGYRPLRGAVRDRRQPDMGRAGRGAGHEEASGVAMLEDGSSFVVGEFEGSATFGLGEPNEKTLNSVGDTDVFVAKYNPTVRSRGREATAAGGPTTRWESPC